MQFEKFSILKIPKICIVANAKNMQFLKYYPFSIYSNFKKHQISKIVQFRTITNFQNTTIWKTIKTPWIYNVINYHIFWMFEWFKQILKWKINTKIKKSNNSSYVILIFEISKLIRLQWIADRSQKDCHWMASGTSNHWIRTTRHI